MKRYKGNKQYFTHCVVCGIELPRPHRSDMRYCSDGCKTIGWRTERKVQIAKERLQLCLPVPPEEKPSSAYWSWLMYLALNDVISEIEDEQAQLKDHTHTPVQIRMKPH